MAELPPFSLKRALDGDEVVNSQHLDIKFGEFYRFPSGVIGYEYKFSDSSTWIVGHLSDGLNCLRMKPRTITVNGFEIAAPENCFPEVDSTYYFPTPSQKMLAVSTAWVGCREDAMRFDRGLVHLTKENAIAHTRAMLNLDPDGGE